MLQTYCVFAKNVVFVGVLLDFFSFLGCVEGERERERDGEEEIINKREELY